MDHRAVLYNVCTSRPRWRRWRGWWVPSGMKLDVEEPEDVGSSNPSLHSTNLDHPSHPLPCKVLRRLYAAAVDGRPIHNMHTISFRPPSLQPFYAQLMIQPNAKSGSGRQDEWRWKASSPGDCSPDGPHREGSRGSAIYPGCRPPAAAPIPPLIAAAVPPAGFIATPLTFLEPSPLPPLPLPAAVPAVLAPAAGVWGGSGCAGGEVAAAPANGVVLLWLLLCWLVVLAMRLICSRWWQVLSSCSTMPVT